MRILRKILLIVITIAMVLAMFFVYKKENSNNKDSETIKEENEKIENFFEQERLLKEELDQAKNDLVVVGMGTTIILIADTNKQCLTDIVPQLDDNHYVGVIAIDDNYSPIDNLPDYLNTSDINSLTDKGYEIVLKVSINDDVKQLYKKYSKYYDIVGFYYQEANISEEQIDYYKQIGITNIIVNGGEVADEKIFSIFSIGTNDQFSRKVFDSANSQSSTVALSIGYASSANKYSKDIFMSMLEKMNVAEASGLTKIGNISEAVNRHNIYCDYLNSKEYKEKLSIVEEIQAKIDELKIQ